MQRNVTNLLLALAMMSLVAGVANAQAPSRMTYQGRLTTAAGAPITTATDVTFTIYDDPNAGSAVWTETITGLTPDANGLFTVELGATTALTGVVFDGSTRYLAIQVSGDAEMTPRQTLNSAPYTVRSATPPGLSQGILQGSAVDVTAAASMIDVVTTSLTIPAAGYIYVQASGLSWLLGSGAQWIFAQIDETAGGATISAYYTVSGNGALPGESFYPITMQRTYFKGAGTYTFRFEAVNGTGTGTKRIWNPVITAMFVPVAYGTVSTVAESGKPSEEGISLSPASIGFSNSAQPGMMETSSSSTGKGSDEERR